MKSRFETENGCDLETLNYEQLLTVARIFAESGPYLIEQGMGLGAVMEKSAQAVQAQMKSVPSRKAGAKIADNFFSELATAALTFRKQIETAAFEMGVMCRAAGLQPQNPIHPTKQ